jgi:hypothetical protein
MIEVWIDLPFFYNFDMGGKVLRFCIFIIFAIGAVAQPAISETPAIGGFGHAGGAAVPFVELFGIGGFSLKGETASELLWVDWYLRREGVTY